MVRCKFLLVSLLVFASPWLYATTANTDTATDTVSAVTEWETSSTNQLPEKQQTATTATAVVRYDSSAVHVRSAATDKYLSDSNFQYDNTGVINPTLWEQFKAWLWSLLQRFLSEDPDTVSAVWDWIYYILIAGVIIFVIFRLFGMTFTGAFRKSVQNGLAVELLGEDIHDMNFDQLIEEAAAQQNYRKAVRLLYLRTLKELTDREYIRWSPDKTNREYVHELSNSDMWKMFEHLTLLFEYIWYGDFPVDRTLFEQARSLFNDFRTTVMAQHV